ncbi:MAG: hypothetical protein KGH59_02615 [Candidatus Micrarchaeota archaeon]|nr:hypothetical protein [Candidatus Micrarchaeota archaeon]
MVLVKNREFGREEANEREQKKIDIAVATAAQNAASMQILNGNYTILKRRDDSKEAAQWFILHGINQIPQGTKSVTFGNSKMLIIQPEEGRSLFEINKGSIASVLEVKKVGVRLMMYTFGQAGGKLADMVMGQMLAGKIGEELTARMVDMDGAEGLIVEIANQCIKDGVIKTMLPVLLRDYSRDFGVRWQVIESFSPLPQKIEEMLDRANNGKLDISLAEEEYCKFVSERRANRENIVAELYLKDGNFKIVAEGDRGRGFMLRMIKHLYYAEPT